MIDLTVYDAVTTQLPLEDRVSVLALQHALRARASEYAYLEIGSHLGGSLQPFLRDPACLAVYSIDPRPEVQPDERGASFAYPGNSTERMIRTLETAHAGVLFKLRTFEKDARDVRREQLTRAPEFCFIDGEDTDQAALSDFEACLRLGAAAHVIAFANVHLVFRAYRRCIDALRDRGITHRAYLLPLKIGVVEVGPLELWRDPAVHERLASSMAPLYIAETLARYRDGILALKRIPGAELARRALLRLGLGRGLERRADPRPTEPSVHRSGR